MDFLTPDEVAERCRVSTQTVLNWIHTKKLPAAQLSPRVYRVPVAAFERFVNRSEPVIPAVSTTPAATWQEGLARYEEHFGLSTADMLRQHAQGQSPKFDSVEDESLFGMWMGAAQIAVAAGLIAAPEHGAADPERATAVA
jgi:excisionase family DNA binding protein